MTYAGHTYTSGIYMSVTLILACMAIVVAVVGLKGVKSSVGNRENEQKQVCDDQLT